MGNKAKTEQKSLERIYADEGDMVAFRKKSQWVDRTNTTKPVGRISRDVEGAVPYRHTITFVDSYHMYKQCSW